METPVLERMKRSVLERRPNLADWLDTAPVSKRKVRLGPADEAAVQAHVQVVDSALLKAEDGAIGLREVCHEYPGFGNL